METKSIQRLQLLHPAIRDKAIDAYNYAVKKTPVGVHPYVTETLRSFDRSAELYAQGRTKPGYIVTNAKAGQSLHNYGFALDFMLQINGKDSWVVDTNWMVVVNIFKAAGFAWGGNFKSIKDFPHLEMSEGLTWKQMLAKYNNKEFIEGTDYIKI